MTGTCRRLRAVSLALLVSSASLGVRAQPPDPSTGRLAALGRLWGVVKLRHPFLAYRTDVDWDAALVAAIPKVRSADDSASFAAAVGGMLAALEDPETRVERSDTADAAGPSTGLTVRTTDD